MKNIIVGTAGHIDHGKTALVKALTGTDADRLEEEKRRGITIDLGFAHLQLAPDIRIGFVDVPGHERFVKNMLAGASGIDLVLLVIAADESIKPQTREHFDICRLLGIRSGIVVLTKSDLADPELVDLVRLEVEDFVAGSFLGSAPVIPVSSVNGSGLDQLRSALAAAARESVARDASGPVRMPIDRSFSIRGFGTVVTGTLLSGAIEPEQELELLPGGRSVRVRGVEAYDQPAARISAGTRTAVNVAGVTQREVRRGMTLAAKGRFDSTTFLDCRVELLPSSRALKSLAPVHFHYGTAEVEAQIRFFGRRDLPPGHSSFARLKLAEPAVLAPGDRFILRQFSPVITIAGGWVVDPHPSRERKPTRIEARLQILAGQDSAAKLALLLDENEGGMNLSQLAARLGLSTEQVRALARKANAILIDRPEWALSRAWLNRWRAGVQESVKRYHALNPLIPGVPKEELRSLLRGAEASLLLDQVLSGMPDLIVEGDRVRHRAHRVVLNSGEEQARRKIEEAFAVAGLSVPPLDDVLSASGIDPTRSQTILRMLLKERTLIKVTDQLVVHHSAISGLKELLATKRAQAFTVSTFKEWTGISRKYAVPLLEFLDREHVTVRKGDARKVM